MSTRETILEQAFVLFASHGYDGVSLSRLLKASGVAKGGFYHHFSSKAEVFRAAAETYVGAVLADALEYLRTNRTDLGRALRFITVYCESLQDIRDGFSLQHFPGFYALIFSDGVHEDDRHPRHTYIEWRAQVRDELVSLLSRGEARGELNPGCDPEGMADHILHTLEGLVLEWSLGLTRDIMPLAIREQQQLLDLIGVRNATDSLAPAQHAGGMSAD